MPASGYLAPARNPRYHASGVGQNRIRIWRLVLALAAVYPGVVDKAVLAIAFASYGASFVAPNPVLTRIAPRRAEPKHEATGVGFWGAGAGLRVLGPSVEQMYDRVPVGVPDTFTTTIMTVEVLRNEEPRLYAEVGREHRRGFLRMVPSMWYGVRTEGDRFVGDGRVAGFGSFLWHPIQHPVVPSGWTIADESVKPVRLRIDYPNSGALGGGIDTQIHEPRRWRLSQIGLSPSETYVVSWRDAWENPLSTGVDRNLKVEDQAAYEMFPEVWAEVRTTVLTNRATGERRTIETPTGWVEAAGRFARRLGSGWTAPNVEAGR